MAGSQYGRSHQDCTAKGVLRGLRLLPLDVQRQRPARPERRLVGRRYRPGRRRGFSVSLSMQATIDCLNYPRYMSKANAHYERIDPRNGVRNSVPGVDSIVMCIVKVHSERIDHRNGGLSLRFGGQSVHNAHLLCSCNWGK